MVFPISCSIGLYFMVCSCSTYWYKKKLGFSTSFCVSTGPCSWDFIDDVSGVGVDSDASSLGVGDEEIYWGEYVVAGYFSEFSSEIKGDMGEFIYVRNRSNFCISFLFFLCENGLILVFKEGIKCSII
jgi:hypothetical protein